MNSTSDFLNVTSDLANIHTNVTTAPLDGAPIDDCDIAAHIKSNVVFHSWFNLVSSFGIGVPGIICNILALIILYRERQRSAVANTTLFILSFCDLLFLLTLVPLRIAFGLMFPGYYNPPEAAKLLYLTLITDLYITPSYSILQNCGIWMTVIMAINRYIAVCVPFMASKINVRLLYTQFIIVLLVSTAASVPYYLRFKIAFMDHGHVMMPYPIMNKALTADFSIHARIYYTYVKPAVFFYIPLIIVVIASARLVVALKAANAKRAAMTQSEDKNPRQKQEHAITVTMVGICVLFLVCYVPDAAYQIYRYSFPTSEDRSRCTYLPHLEAVVTAFYMLSSSGNFFVYITAHSTFRGKLKQLCCPGSTMEIFSIQGTRSTGGSSRQSKSPQDASNSIAA